MSDVMPEVNCPLGMISITAETVGVDGSGQLAENEPRNRGTWRRTLSMIDLLQSATSSWQSKGLLFKVVVILQLPMRLILSIVVPVAYDGEEYDHQWDQVCALLIPRAVPVPFYHTDTDFTCHHRALKSKLVDVFFLSWV